MKELFNYLIKPQKQTTFLIDLFNERKLYVGKNATHNKFENWNDECYNIDKSTAFSMGNFFQLYGNCSYSMNFFSRVLTIADRVENIIRDL